MLIIVIHIESTVKVHWLLLGWLLNTMPDFISVPRLMSLFEDSNWSHRSQKLSRPVILFCKNVELDLGNQEVVRINASDSVVCSFHCVGPQHILFLSHISFQLTENYFWTSRRQTRTRIIELSSMSTSWLVTNFNVSAFCTTNDLANKLANKHKELEWS